MSWFFQPVLTAAPILLGTVSGDKTFTFTIEGDISITTSLQIATLLGVSISESQTVSNVPVSRVRKINAAIAETSGLSISTLKRTRNLLSQIDEAQSITPAIVRSRKMVYTVAETSGLTLTQLKRARKVVSQIDEAQTIAANIIRSRKLISSVVEQIAYTIALTTYQLGTDKDFSFAVSQATTLLNSIIRSRKLVYSIVEQEAITVNAVSRARKLVTSISEQEAITVGTIKRSRKLVTSISEQSTLSVSQLNRARKIIAALNEQLSIIVSLEKIAESIKSFTFLITETESMSASIARLRGLQQQITQQIAIIETIKRIRGVVSSVNEASTQSISTIVRGRTTSFSVQEHSEIIGNLRRTLNAVFNVSENETFTFEFSSQVETNTIKITASVFNWEYNATSGTTKPVPLVLTFVFNKIISSPAIPVVDKIVTAIKMEPLP